MLIIYVCHNEESVRICLEKTPDAYIMLVGSEVLSFSSEKIIIVRDLLDNIEDEKKLLTFTAWYAIVKNNLFLDEKHICIVEWDTFLPNLKDIDFTEDIYSFFYDDGRNFRNDINLLKYK